MADIAVGYYYALTPTGNSNEFEITSAPIAYQGGLEVTSPEWGLEQIRVGDYLRDWQGDNTPLKGTYLGSWKDGIVLDQNGTYFYASAREYPNEQQGTTFTITADNYVPCFLAGTLIACPEGERPVEELLPGDLILTAGGETRAVRWIGRQTILSVAADPIRAYPVHVMAGALAEGLPRRDLFLSPGHALVIDGLLVHAGALVNDTTIRRVMQPGPSFCYFHVETEDHAIILAEGTPTETFLDAVSRRRFENHAEFEMLHGASVAPIAPLRLPRVKSARQLPLPIRDRLEARARQLLPSIDAAA